jgi:Arc/MetJ family transcription regulator
MAAAEEAVGETVRAAVVAGATNSELRERRAARRTAALRAVERRLSGCDGWVLPTP